MQEISCLSHNIQFIPQGERRSIMPTRLADWAKKRGISYMTAWRWEKEGKIPYPIERIGRTVFVLDDQHKTTVTELHCPKCGEVIEVELR